MENKHGITAFDIVLFIVFLALGFILWSFLQAISLVKPTTQFEFDVSQPVGATAQVESSDSKADLLKVKDKFEDELHRAVERFVDMQPNKFGIYVEHLKSGVAAEHNGQLEMTMASLYKPFAAVEALKMVDAGLLDLSQPVTDDGNSVGRCIEKAISISDNPCGLALLNVTRLSSDFGLSKLQTLGYKHTDLRGYLPTTTPRDVAMLLKNIYSGTDLSDIGRKKILSALLNQRVNDRLPIGLPDGVRLANKTGDLKGYAHDAGLVLYGEDADYVIVVMSGPDSSGRLLAQRYADFGRLAETIHQVMVDYSRELAALSS